MMNNTRRTVLLAIIIIVALIICILCYFFYDMNSLPKGELLESIESPTNEYTINSYIVRNSLSADAIRVELINNKTTKRKNIYWGYPENIADIKWRDKETVEINEHVLNIHKDIYDWRKQ